MRAPAQPSGLTSRTYVLNFECEACRRFPSYAAHPSREGFRYRVPCSVHVGEVTVEMMARDGQGGSPREEAFTQLVERVQSCRACPRMEHRLRVLGPANGHIG